MKKMKKIRLICLFFAAVMLFSACDLLNGDKNTETTDSNKEISASLDTSFSAFQILRSDNATQDMINEVIQLNNAIKEHTGENLTVRIDYSAADEKPCEILVGDVNRAESKAILAELEPGEYVVKTVVTDSAVKLVILGSDDHFTFKAINHFIELLTGNSVIAADGKMNTLCEEFDYYAAYESYHIELGEPIVVAQPEEVDNVWGHYQFPSLYETLGGNVMIKWTMHNDTIEGGASQCMFSKDGGKTWEPWTKDDVMLYGVRMNNGKYFLGFDAGSVVEAGDWLSKYTPKITNAVINGVGPTYTYMAADIKEFDNRVYATEYDPTTNTYTKFEVNLDWPYMPLEVYPPLTAGGAKRIYPTANQFAVSGLYGLEEKDGDLYFCMYTHGINSANGTANKYHKYLSIYVFKSSDMGRSWKYISQVSPSKDNADIGNVGYEGFGECSMSVTKDGTLVMLMRTGADFNNKKGLPCYITRSTDNGQTWSTPEVFGPVGVMPQIEMLECGVTLAVYGRPGLYMRTSNDLTASEWSDPIEIPLSEGAEWRSCYYTYILPLSETTALLAYSDFHYPNQNGSGTRKTILVRTVTVIPNT